MIETRVFRRAIPVGVTTRPETVTPEASLLMKTSEAPPTFGACIGLAVGKLTEAVRPKM